MRNQIPVPVKEQPVSHITVPCNKGTVAKQTYRQLAGGSKATRSSQGEAAYSKYVRELKAANSSPTRVLNTKLTKAWQLANANAVVLPAKFAYDLADAKHYIVWLKPPKGRRPSWNVDALRARARAAMQKAGHGREFVMQVNPPGRRSIQAIEHVHVFVPMQAQTCSPQSAARRSCLPGPNGGAEAASPVQTLTTRLLHTGPQFLINFVSLCSGIGAGVQGLCQGNLIPILLNDICTTAAKMLRLRYDTPVVDADATSEHFRHVLQCVKQFYGEIHLISAGFPCQGNSKLNKNADVTRNNNPTTGDKRLWLGLKLMETMLSVSPWLIVVEQLRNYQQTAVFKLVVAMAEKRGYRARTFDIDACFWSIPQMRKRTYIFFERLGHRIGTSPLWLPGRWPSDVFAQIRRERRSKPKASLGQWWDEKVFYNYCSEDRLREVPRLRGPNDQAATVTTKTVGADRPPFREYRWRKDDKGSRNKETYNSAYDFTVPDLLRLQGLPGALPLPQLGWQCKDKYNPCLARYHSRWDHSTAGLLVGNAMTVTVMEGVAVALDASLCHIIHGKRLEPRLFAKCWRPNVITRAPTDPVKDHVKRYHHKRQRWSVGGHWEADKCDHTCMCCKHKWLLKMARANHQVVTISAVTEARACRVCHDYYLDNDSARVLQRKAPMTRKAKALHAVLGARPVAHNFLGESPQIRAKVNNLRNTVADIHRLDHEYHKVTPQQAVELENMERVREWNPHPHLVKDCFAYLMECDAAMEHNQRVVCGARQSAAQPKDVTLDSMVKADVKLGQHALAAYLRQRGEKPAAKHYTIEQVEFGPKVPSSVKQKFLDLLQAEDSALLVKHSMSLPKPFLDKDGNEYVHSLLLKEHAKPQKCQCPRFPPGSAKRRCLVEIAAENISSGLWKPSTHGEWASRPHLVGKFDIDSDRTAVPTALRFVGDYVQVNTQCRQSAVQNNWPPDQWRKLQRDSTTGQRWFLQIDAASQYHSIRICEKSQEVLAMFVPHGSRVVLVRPTRLPMGARNAGQIAQSLYDQMFAEELDVNVQRQLVSSADDIVLFADRLEDLLPLARELFAVLRKHQVQVKPSKIKIGFERVEFWAWSFDINGRSPADRSLCPIRKMRPPVTMTEHQHVMGVFNQFSSYLGPPSKLTDPNARKAEALKGYRLVAEPLIRLLRKDPVGGRPWVERWDEKAQKVFDFFKSKLLAGVHLHNPKSDRSLMIMSDASAEGWGGYLYQLSDEGEFCCIDHWSKPFTGYAKTASPFYREALGHLNTVDQARYYLMANYHQPIAKTDHLPLTWNKACQGKAGLSSWRYQRSKEFCIDVQYIAGPRNKADAISRPPFLGPHVYATQGLIVMTDWMLELLPASIKDARRMWVYAEKDTAALARHVQRWRTPRNPVQKFSTSDERIAKQGFDMLIAAVTPFSLSRVAQALSKVEQPFALLVPSNLVNFLCEYHGPMPQSGDEKDVSATGRRIDKATCEMIAKAHKFAMLSEEFTWVLGRCGVAGATVRVLQTAKVAPQDTIITDDDSSKGGVVLAMTPTAGTSVASNPAEWKALQREMMSSDEVTKYKNNIVHRASDDSYLYLEAGKAPRHIVPKALRTRLIEMVHKAQHHLSAMYNTRHLRDHYWWPRLAGDVDDYVSKCAVCALSDVTRRAAHKSFHAAPSQVPTMHVGCDLKGMVESEDGYKQILVWVDMATLYVVFKALKRRTSDNLMHSFRDDVVNVWGLPAVLYSDHAAEIVKGAVKQYCTRKRIAQRSTLGYNPRGNSVVERIMRYLNFALRSLKDSEYAKWNHELSSMAAGWNSHYVRTMGCTPYKARHGFPMRTHASTAMEPQESKVEEPEEISEQMLQAIQHSVGGYQKLASATLQWHRRHTAGRLNAIGNRRVFESGDRVKIFIPPSATEAAQRGRKVKHLGWYRPATVVSQDSDTTYTVKDDKGRVFRRTITNIAPLSKDIKFDELDKGGHELSAAENEAKAPAAQATTLSPTTSTCPADPYELEIDSFVAVIEDPSSPNFEIAKVISRTGDYVTLHIYGTHAGGNSLRTARYKPLWMVPAGQQAGGESQVQYNPPHSDHSTDRWQWEIDARNLPELVIARRLVLCASGLLNVASRRVLDNMGGTRTHRNYS